MLENLLKHLVEMLSAVEHQGHCRCCIWTEQFLVKASDHSQNQSMRCAHLNGQHGATGERNITQGQLLLDVYNCGLLVHLRRLFHHNQSDTNATHICTGDKTGHLSLCHLQKQCSFYDIARDHAEIQKNSANCLSTFTNSNNPLHSFTNLSDKRVVTHHI